MIRLLPLLLLMLAGCSPLGTFNAVMPRDDGAGLVAEDQLFAPGPRGMLDLYAPTSAPPRGGRPVIVFFYGGSWKSGSRGGYGFAAQALAAQGFLVALPDYRLVPEIGFPAFLEDNAKAVLWVRANARRFGGDPDRIVLAGHSAGAYNAAMLSVDPQWLGAERKAIRGFATLAGPFDFLPLDTEATVDAFGRTADLESTQPIAFASADDPPALLLHGARDDRVRPLQSRRMAAALEAAGAKAELRIYPDIGHVGIITALTPLLRANAPVLDDVARFARRVSAIPSGRP